MIAKGKITRAEQSQFGTIDQHEIDHSLSGWTTVETFRYYLE
jgi:hypothetical protein